MTHFGRQLSSRARKRIVGEKLPIKSASNDAMRLVAFIFDIIIAALIAFTCDYFFHFEEKTAWIFFGVLMVLRDSLMQGGSLGKRLCGLIIVDFYSLKPLSRMRCIQRQCLFYVGMGTLVFLGYALSKKMGYQYGIYPFTGLLFLPLFEQIKGGRTICDKSSNAFLVKTKEWKLSKLT